MNKKFLTFSLLGLFVIALVSAGAYYVLFTTTFSVNNINGMGEYSNPIDGVVEFGKVISGASIFLENDLENDRGILITTSSHPGIDVTYKSTLELTKKDVDFNSDVWNIPEDAEKVGIEYTLVGDSFEAEVTNNEKTGYVLVYYSDNIDRFTNPNVAIKVEDVSGNLPYVDDENADVYDYCATGEYSTCHGAKIWYVPESALTDNTDGTWSISWGQASEFYFESKLIQYNVDGEITFYSGDSLEITPEFTVTDEYVVGEQSITTTIA